MFSLLELVEHIYCMIGLFECTMGDRNSEVKCACECTIMERSSAPFSLGCDNLKRYFDQR